MVLYYILSTILDQAIHFWMMYRYIFFRFGLVLFTNISMQDQNFMSNTGNAQVTTHTIIVCVI